MYKYLFGPVNSRRLGLSLGIDMVPFKTCSFNCIFCQLGCTAHTTLARKEYSPVKDIESELADWLSKGGAADYITLSGSGEPTLHTGLERLIDIIHGMCRIKVAVLTNSSLLWDDNVRRSLLTADLVKASLSVFDDESLRRVNQPADGIDFKTYFQGILDFRKVFKGSLWLEIFLVKGVNDHPAAISRLAESARRVGAERIQLNTVSRPPADKDAAAVPYSEMQSVLGLFGANAEITADYRQPLPAAATPVDESAIAELAKRHPVRVSDICALYNCPENEAAAKLDKLAGEGVLSRYMSAGEYYYADPAGR